MIRKTLLLCVITLTLFATTFAQTEEETVEETGVVTEDEASVEGAMEESGDYGTALISAIQYRDAASVTRLLEGGADPNTADEGGWTVLMYAAAGGDTNIISSLLTMGARTDAKRGKWTPAGIAEYYGNKEAETLLRMPEYVASAVVRGDYVRTKALLDKGASANATTIDGTPAIVIAVNNQDVAITKLLIEQGADLDAQDSGTSRTALVYCAREGFLEMAKLLLENGANPDVGDMYQSTALMSAAFRGYTEICQALIDTGADVNSGNEDGWTPLIFAVYANRIPVAQQLLAAQADINGADATGKTPLVYAAQLGHIEMVAFLLENGADPNARNADGQAVLDIVTPDAQPEIAGMIIAAGGEDTASYTPLMYAAQKGDLTLTKMIVKDGADVNAQRADGKTALMYAAGEGHTDVVAYLLEQNADATLTSGEEKRALTYAQEAGHTAVVETIKRLTGNGKTALMYVCEQGDANGVALIMNAGADVDAVDVTGKTALMYAAEQGHIDIVIFLIEQGANTELRDAEGNSAGDLAKSAGHDEVAAMLGAEEEANASMTPEEEALTAFFTTLDEPLNEYIAVYFDDSGKCLRYIEEVLTPGFVTEQESTLSLYTFTAEQKEIFNTALLEIYNGLVEAVSEEYALMFMGALKPVTDIFTIE